MSRSWFWLLGGPNGSGKSTFAATDVFAKLTRTPEAPHELTMINPDVLAREIRANRPGAGADEIAREAATRSDSQVHALIGDGKPLLVETVLSTAKFRPCVIEAKQKNYRFGLVYVILKRPDLNIARVEQRVQLDGHRVDPIKIVERYGKSLQQLKWFAPQADYFSMWDNSKTGGPPELLIEANPQRLLVTPETEAILEDANAEPMLKHAIHDLIDVFDA
ncbi:MAG: zeta toxin family protein [Hyphomonadaceae bacterium]